MLTENQQAIEGAIRMNCTGEKPFTTVGEIADTVPFSDQTVLNNIDEVVATRDDIDSRTVGQANVYYVKSNLMDEIWREDTQDTVTLFDTPGQAAYVEIRNAPDSSAFDFEAHWYDYQVNELDGYVPTGEEMGRAIVSYGSDPVAIKFYDQSDLDDEFERVEDPDIG